MSVNEQEVAAMRERLRMRQEERRALADIDALARIVSASRRPETIGVIVPIEEARDFAEFQKARRNSMLFRLISMAGSLSNSGHHTIAKKQRAE